MREVEGWRQRQTADWCNIARKRNQMKQKRTCNKCKSAILKTHRWRTVWHKFLWFRWETIQHRDCARPTEIHKHVTRLKGEVPLPFMYYEEHA